MYLDSVLSSLSNKRGRITAEDLYRLNEALFNLPAEDSVKPKTVAKCFSLLENIHKDRHAFTDSQLFYDYVALLGTFQNQSFLSLQQGNQVSAWINEACGGKKATQSQPKVEGAALKSLQAETARLRQEVKRYKELCDALGGLAEFQVEPKEKSESKAKNDSVKNSAPLDYCVITASTPAQAKLYKALVQRRIDCGMYPDNLKFRFYSDPKNGRVGSGGGTLVALHELFKQETRKQLFSADGVDEAKAKAFFGSKRILVLHAGGESRRLPCYVPEGKLFGPLSIASSDGAKCPPVVLDLVLSLYFKYPWRRGEVIMASGDVIVDFDTTTLTRKDSPFLRGGICGFGKAASLEQGSRHGVFAFEQKPDEGSNAATLAVSDFHQKSPVQVLAKECLVPGTKDKCALDIGIFSMSTEWCLALFHFAASLVSPLGLTVMTAVDESKLYFDFYLEVVIASLPGLSKDAYLKRMGASELPVEVLEALHGHMQGLELRGALVSDCMFLHFGTLTEFPEASIEASQYALTPFYVSRKRKKAKESKGSSDFANAEDGIRLLNCSSQGMNVTRSSTSASVNEKPETAWVEMCSNVTVPLSPKGFHILIGLQNLSVFEPLPAGICLDGRRIKGKRIVATYSIKDTFKKVKTPSDVIFCGVPLPSWLKERGLTAADVWDEADATSATDLWTAKLFCESQSSWSAEFQSNFLQGYWDIKSWSSKEAFLEVPRFSLGQLNRDDSALQRDQLRIKNFLKEPVSQGKKQKKKDSKL